MDNPTGLFKFSRAGKVIHEGIPYDQALRLITDGAILPSDFYWVAGMADWQRGRIRGQVVTRQLLILNARIKCGLGIRWI